MTAVAGVQFDTVLYALKLIVVYLFCAALLAVRLQAHDIITTKLTYTRDISRIFVQHCAACHQSTAAVPLSTYEEVRPWAVSIKEQVLSRAMPPWGAVKGFGDLLPDHALTQEDILIISAWVVGGAPQGDPALLPKQKQQSLAAPRSPALQDGLTVSTRTVLTKKIAVSGLKPLCERTIQSARITARLPDGRIQPLVWLYQFDPQLDQPFRFREPMNLPPQTVIESSAPLRFTLEITAPSPGQ